VKKLAAILLTALLLFNWVGYRLFFGYMEAQSNQAMNARLDIDDYDEANLITIKIPVTNLPYYTNSPIFERVKGNINIDGHEYQYVEKRIYNDSLEMRCIRNQQITHISNARDAFFQLVNDLQQADGKPAPAKPVISLKNILPDYISTATVYGYEPVFTVVQHSYLDFSDRLPVCFLSTPDRPPLASAFS